MNTFTATFTDAHSFAIEAPQAQLEWIEEHTGIQATGIQSFDFSFNRRTATDTLKVVVCNNKARKTTLLFNLTN